MVALTVGPCLPSPKRNQYIVLGVRREMVRMNKRFSSVHDAATHCLAFGPCFVQTIRGRPELYDPEVPSGSRHLNRMEVADTLKTERRYRRSNSVLACRCCFCTSGSLLLSKLMECNSNMEEERE